MPISIDQLLNDTEHQLRDAERRRDLALAGAQSILDGVQTAARQNLTADEERHFNDYRAEARRAGEDIEVQRGRRAEARRIAAEEEATQRGYQVRFPTAAAERSRQSYDRQMRVGAESRVYRPDEDRDGRRFLDDVVRNFLYQDVEAQSRLARHMQEERVERGEYLTRAAGTGAFAGLTVPQYLTDLYAPATAPLRPFADVCNSHPLPDAGMTLNLSRITTATSAALQASENVAVSETNIDDTLLTLNVQTAAGQQTISRQAAERGTGTEEVTVGDLFKRVATVLDSTLLNQAATGLTNVAQSNAYTDASPTGAELYPKILGAANGVETALLAQGMATHVIMHPRRWNWLSSQMTSTWPMVSQPGIPVHASATNAGTAYAAGIRGTLPNGLLVVADGNVGTTLGAGTEDEVYVVAASECHLWEDQEAPMFIRAEQPNAASLGVLLVAYSYFAYTFARYTNGTQKVNGTGLISPVF